MSKIDKLIEELQLKKTKIDYLNYLLNIIKTDEHCVDYKEIKNEMVSKIEPLLKNLITEIEDGTITEVKLEGDFSKDELNTLKALAERANAKNVIVDAKPADTRPKELVLNKKEPMMSVHEKMQFSLSHRHLANASVNVMNDQNVTITGKVVGIDAPYLVIKTESGPVIKVPPEKVSMA